MQGIATRQGSSLVTVNGDLPSWVDNVAAVRFRAGFAWPAQAVGAALVVAGGHHDAGEQETLQTQST